MFWKSDGVPSVPKLRLDIEGDSNLPEAGLETFILAKRRRRSTLRAVPLPELGAAVVDIACAASDDDPAGGFVEFVADD
jgi:hypothetical protein